MSDFISRLPALLFALTMLGAIGGTIGRDDIVRLWRKIQCIGARK